MPGAGRTGLSNVRDDRDGVTDGDGAPETAFEHVGTVGQPLVFTDVTVVADGAACDPGERGEIVVDGPTVTPGYLNGDDDAFSDLGFRTTTSATGTADGQSSKAVSRPIVLAERTSTRRRLLTPFANTRQSRTRPSWVFRTKSGGSGSPRWSSETYAYGGSRPLC